MLISGTFETCIEGTDAPGAFVALPPVGLLIATRLTVIDGDAVANRFRALLLALFAAASAVRFRAVLLAGLMTVVFGNPEAAEIEPVPPGDAFPMGICTGDAFLVSWLAFTTYFCNGLLLAATLPATDGPAGRVTTVVDSCGLVMVINPAGAALVRVETVDGAVCPRYAVDAVDATVGVFKT